MRCMKHSKLKMCLRLWPVTLFLSLGSCLVLTYCAGSDVSCSNLNVFSFWSKSQNPGCVHEYCSEAPYALMFDGSKQQVSGNNASVNEDLTSTVHLSIVACGNDRLEETLVSIKSAVLLTTAPLHVHIFADDELRPQFKQSIDNWPLFVHKKLTTSLYPISYPNVNAAEWIKLFKPCATQRLFIPYLIPESITDQVLYVDTDILFMRPLEHIWKFFTRFNTSHIAALAPEHEWDRQGWYNRFARHPYFGETGVNSGVMLMKLSMMRDMSWIEKMIEYHKEYKLKITWGDQDLINIFFHYYPEKLYVYPCQWNFRPDHCMYGINCEQAKKRGVSIVHGNRGVYHNDKQPVFKAIYNIIKDFPFGGNLEAGLLGPMKVSIKALESSGYCGRSGDAFTAQLERQLNLAKLNQEVCDQNPTKCEAFEREDFELEAKYQMKVVKKTQPKKESQSESQTKQDKKNKKDKKESQPVPVDISDELYDALTTGLVTKFPKITAKKLLPILKEHLTRMENSRERHEKDMAGQKENDDSALLSPALHEDIIGYVQSLDKIKSPSDYMKVLMAVIKKLEENKSVASETEPEAKSDEMHLAVIACGDLLEQPIVMIKSAVLQARNFLHVHVFADEDLQPRFKEILESWPEKAQKKFKLHIHDIHYPVKNAEKWRTMFKKCATQRLFLPTLLTDVDSVIYVDTDILFLRPIDDLWAMFKQFNSTQIAALAPEHLDPGISWYKRFARHPYYPPLGVNSGVMPMNLTRMREAKWQEHMVPYFEKYYYNTTWGDQDLINIFFHFFPEKLFVFACDWNYRQDQCMYMHTCKEAEQNGVSILHGSRQVYHNDKEPAFKAVYQAIRDYQFGSGLKTNLLKNMKNNIAKQRQTNCGKVGWVLTKQLEEQVKLKKK